MHLRVGYVWKPYIPSFAQWNRMRFLFVIRHSSLGKKAVFLHVSKAFETGFFALMSWWLFLFVPSKWVSLWEDADLLLRASLMQNLSTNFFQSWLHWRMLTFHWTLINNLDCSSSCYLFLLVPNCMFYQHALFALSTIKLGPFICMEQLAYIH